MQSISQILKRLSLFLFISLYVQSVQADMTLANQAYQQKHY